MKRKRDPKKLVVWGDSSTGTEQDRPSHPELGPQKHQSWERPLGLTLPTPFLPNSDLMLLRCGVHTPSPCLPPFSLPPLLAEAQRSGKY